MRLLHSVLSLKVYQLFHFRKRWIKVICRKTVIENTKIQKGTGNE